MLAHAKALLVVCLCVRVENACETCVFSAFRLHAKDCPVVQEHGKLSEMFLKKED